MEFTEDQKRCYGPYPLPDGGQAWADPLLAHRHLVALLGGDLGRVIGELKGSDPGLKYQSTSQTAWAVCEVFGLPPFDAATGQGTTASAALALLADFLHWVEAQKKSGGPTPGTSSAA